MFHYSYYLITTLLAASVALHSCQPQGFTAPAREEQPKIVVAIAEDKSDDLATASANTNYRQQQQVYEYDEEEEEAAAAPTASVHHNQQINRRQQNQQQYVRKGGQTNRDILDELEDEREEPDRLTQLLEKSAFKCEGRTG